MAGFVGVEENRFADLTPYTHLVLRGSGSGLRILANRLVAHGPWKQIVVSFNEKDPYWNADYQAIVVPLEDLKTIPTTNDGQNRVDEFVHLNVLKVDWNSTVNVLGAYLIPSEETLEISALEHGRTSRDTYYNLNGQAVAHPTRGLYIYNGKKVYIK